MRSASNPIRLIFTLALALALASTLSACAADRASYSDQRTFHSPENAATELAAAARDNDVRRLEAIFGPGADQVLSSGDPIADQHNREVFAVAMAQGWTIDRIDADSRELIVGHEHWPFPIPIVKDSRGWWFDTDAGAQEILARRIGRNELAAIGVLRTYAIAQREYAAQPHDNRPAGTFAQQVMSDPGRHNGLYWPAEPGAPTSPLGEFAAQAEKEGYDGNAREGSRPYQGYFFRILTAQGPDAPGGAMSYLVNNDMTKGFAMIAHPAQYMSSGVMTFIVGPDGVVHEADLGPDTSSLVKSIVEYNPDDAWREVE